MRSSFVLLAGLFAGALGIALWVSANEFFEANFAWGAIGVGAFVGLGLLFFGEGRAKSDLTFMGGFLAMLTIAGGTVLNEYISTRYDTEFILGNLADGILGSFEEMGHTLQWREESDPEQQFTKAGYPPELWRKAVEMWQEATPEQRMEYRADLESQHGLGIKAVAIASFDVEALSYLVGGMFASSLIGLIFGGFMHESVIVTAYRDAAENEPVGTHPYLAPGSEYGFTDEEQALAEQSQLDDAPADAVASAPQTDEKPQAPVEESDSSFAGFASQEPAEDDSMPGFDNTNEDSQKKAG